MNYQGNNGDRWAFKECTYVNNYYDAGYFMYYKQSGQSDLQAENAGKAYLNNCMDAVANRYFDLFGLVITRNDATYFESALDICKAPVTDTNILSLCPTSHTAVDSSGVTHTRIHSYRRQKPEVTLDENVLPYFQDRHTGNDLTTNAYWSCHRILSYNAKGDLEENRSCSSGTNIIMVGRSSAVDREQDTIGVFMLELNHQYAGDDHYHEMKKLENGDLECKSKGICSGKWDDILEDYVCADTKEDDMRPHTCIMNRSRQDISSNEILCEDCFKKIKDHLDEHHQ